MQQSYLPLLIKYVEKCLSLRSTSPKFVCLCGPQGSGKSTAVELIKSHFNKLGFSLVTLSLDDFYWPFKDQQSLSRDDKYKQNPLLEYRGNPGTHDLALLSDCLQSLKKGGQTVKLPQYDKSLNKGRGDRLPFSSWPTAPSKVDLVLFEGWLMGYTCMDNVSAEFNTNLAIEPAQIEQINTFLREYERTLYPYFMRWIRIAPQNGDYGLVYKWRWSQEQSLKRRLGKDSAGMNELEVRQFVDRFMPVYLNFPSRSFPDQLCVTVDADRRVISWSETENEKLIAES